MLRVPERTCSESRQHILHLGTISQMLPTHSEYRQHVLLFDTIFGMSPTYLTYPQYTYLKIVPTHSASRQHILNITSTFCISTPYPECRQRRCDSLLVPNTCTPNLTNTLCISPTHSASHRHILLIPNMHIRILATHSDIANIFGISASARYPI